MKKVFFLITALILLIYSIYLHGQNISRPLNGHHDFMNGFLLTVTSIWRNEGILKYTFAPVYTFNNFAKIREGFGIEGKDGRMYYVSYPPGVYIIYYYLSKLPGVGISVSGTRVMSLIFFYITAILLTYFLFSRYGKLTALFGFGIYSLFPVSAYFLGTNFNVDTAILPFWFLVFLVFRNLTKRPKSHHAYFLFYIIIFILTQIEWQGFFIAFSIFMLILIFGHKLGWSRKYRILFLINLFLTVILSLMMIYVIFSLRIENDVLLGQLLNRFFYRTNTGIYSSGLLMNDVIIYLEKFYERFIYHINIGFGSFFPYLLISAFILSVLSKRFKTRLFEQKELLLYIFVIILSSILHFVILSNFHLEHDIGNLYIFFTVTFVLVWGYKVAETLIIKTFRAPGFYLSLILIIFLLVAIVYSSQSGYKTYSKDWIYEPVFYSTFYKNIQQNSQSDDLILTNYDSSPYNWFYFQRAVLGGMYGDQVKYYQNSNPNIKNIYFMSDIKANNEVSCGNRSIYLKNLLYICKLN